MKYIPPGTTDRAGPKWEDLPLAPTAPSGVRVRLLLEPTVEKDPFAWPEYRFPERSRCRVVIRGAEFPRIEARAGETEHPGELIEIAEKEVVWTFDWGDYVGISRLRIEVDGAAVLDLPVEVYSRKLGYDEDYRRLLDELADWLATLVFSVATPTALPSILAGPGQGSLYLQYLLLRWLMAPQRLPGAFERVRAEPHRRVIRESRWVNFGRARDVAPHGLIDLVAQADLVHATTVVAPAVARVLRGRVPREIVETHPRTEFDTPENRFVGHLLDLLALRLGHLERTFRRDAEAHPARADLAHLLAEDCRRWARRVSEMRRAPFLKEVGPMRVFPASSQVLRRREGYRQLRDAYLRLLSAPQVRWEGLEEVLRVPARDVPTLYEYWCFFTLADALMRAGGASPRWDEIVCLEADCWEIRLRQGEASSVRIGPARLWYNRGFRQPNSYSLPLRPDYTVQVGQRLWLFDAKYRLEWQDIASALQKESEGADDEATFKRADLYKMHAYRDAIREAVAVFILYPGTVFRAFGADGRQYDDPADLPTDFEGVGAIPLRPGHTNDLESVIQALVREGPTPRT